MQRFFFRLPFIQIGKTSLPFLSRTRSLHTSRTLQKLETWQEVDMNRPRVPKVEDYVRPKKAPDPNQLTREQFRQFMRGKPQRFSVELQQFIGAWIILGFISSEVMLTLYIMRPDDFEWVEEERARLEAAKRKMARLQQYQENLAAKRAAEEEGASASAGV
mmetsp:Transcript_35044/g.69162  ORF Transcript_35044/g.69162 Transcript_35044/m.69162 type:complete len:161 (+) Transcript_35044:148-630(+)